LKARIAFGSDVSVLLLYLVTVSSAAEAQN
jgi:hypothetical protein